MGRIFLPTESLRITLYYGALTSSINRCPLKTLAVTTFFGRGLGNVVITHVHLTKRHVFMLHDVRELVQQVLISMQQVLILILMLSVVRKEA